MNLCNTRPALQNFVCIFTCLEAEIARLEEELRDAKRRKSLVSRGSDDGTD